MSSSPALSRHRRGVRLAATAAASGLALLGFPALADAHVRVSADSTTAGAFSALTFRVPTESDTASTVKLTVQLPQDKPFLDVSSKPVPGWTVTSTEQKLPEPVTMEGTTITKAPRTVTWTAAKGSGIEPGQYQEFSLSVGPLPAAGSDVLLPATQTYSDGTVVTWDQPTPSSGEEPEHPAPELVVTGAAASSSPSPSDGSSTTSTTAAASSDGVARGLGVAALVVAVAGLAVTVLRGRRRA